MTAQPHEEVFSGDWKECLRHFAQRITEIAPKGTQKAIQTRMPIAQFVGTSPKTVTNWIYERTKGNHPTGEKLLRLICLMSMHGYHVKELERLNRGERLNLRRYFELIGFRVLDIEQAAKLIGYARGGRIMEILFLKEHAGKQKINSMNQVWQELRGELEQKKAEAQKYLIVGLVQPDNNSNSVLSTLSNTPQSIQITALSQNQYGTLHIMRGLVELLQNGGFHNLSELELNALRDEGGNTILQLSTALADLNSRLFRSERK